MNLGKTEDNFKLEMARKSLTGISIGDAFGEGFFGNMDLMEEAVLLRTAPRMSWEFTDDTIMAISIYKSLEKYGAINQNFLSQLFLENYIKDSYRGYGPSMHEYFRNIQEGRDWKSVAMEKFSGMGSMGNGGAMRASLIGAYFYDDLDRVTEESTLSCTVTHTSVEAICGTIAVAKATALITQASLQLHEYSREWFFAKIIEGLPDCDTLWKIRKAAHMKEDYAIKTMVFALGNGEKMLAQDTVPLSLWCVANQFNDFESCLWKTASAFGDRDTLCAISGGIAIMSANPKTIPQEWTKSVESWRKSNFYN